MRFDYHALEILSNSRTAGEVRIQLLDTTDDDLDDQPESQNGLNDRHIDEENAKNSDRKIASFIR